MSGGGVRAKAAYAAISLKSLTTRPQIMAIAHMVWTTSMSPVRPPLLSRVLNPPNPDLVWLVGLAGFREGQTLGVNRIG